MFNGKQFYSDFFHRVQYLKLTQCFGRSQLNGRLQEAFMSGNVSKVLQCTTGVTGVSRSKLSSVIKQWQRSKNTMTPLTAAIVNGNYPLTKLLVDDGAPVTIDTPRQMQPLSLSLKRNYHKIAELLIHSGADVNKLEFDTSYPICWAILKKNPCYIIELIIITGFPVNAIVLRAMEMRAIHLAVSENYMEAAQILFKHSADLNVLNKSGETPVIMAVRQNLPDMVKLLVKHGAMLDYEEAKSCSLFVAIRFKLLAMVETLLGLGANIEEGWVDQVRISPLQFAIGYVLNVDIIKLLISKGANVNSKNPATNETPLHSATNYVNLEEIAESVMNAKQCDVGKALIENGADVNAMDSEGRTPLDCAIFSENLELCKLLLMAGADICGMGVLKVNVQPTHRFVYIMRNKFLATPELIRLCLERGADYNYPKVYDYAAANGSQEIVKLLWQYGCPFDEPKPVGALLSNKLMKSVDYSKVYSMVDHMIPSRCRIDKSYLKMQSYFINGIKNNNLELVKHLLGRGVEPKGCSAKIPHPLHYAAVKGNHKLVHLLLEKGVPVNRVNGQGETALYISAKKKHYKTCLVLLQFGACFSPKGPEVGITIHELVKQQQSIQELFTKINKVFRLVKDGDITVLELLKQYKKSNKDNGILCAIMNCADARGLTATGTALQLEHTEIARGLMSIRLEM